MPPRSAIEYGSDVVGLAQFSSPRGRVQARRRRPLPDLVAARPGLGRDAVRTLARWLIDERGITG